jgi:histo-blood group ABO system transferase
MDKDIKKKRIALLIISTGHLYWQYINAVLESADRFLLPNQEVDYFLFTDWDISPEDFNLKRKINVIPIENVGYPYCTLMRYHIFLKEEEKLKDYDHLIYCDVDMLFVDTVGDEVLSDGITATRHPAYAFPHREHWDVEKDGIAGEIYFLPFEPNPQSTAYIPYPKLYFCGGFQVGKTEKYLDAMYAIKRAIDDDFGNNYIARWHDESHWNKYLWDNPPAKVLSPSYCYPVAYPTPDKPPYPTIPYYRKVWLKDYEPKLLCLTKAHTLSKQGGKEFGELQKKLG